MKVQQTTIVAVLASVLLLISVPAAAGTIVGGFIMSDTTWTAAGGPYIVEDSIAVIGGATLTVDPGVEVRFEPGLALVVDTGALIARGTELSPIRFTANQGIANRWAYLQFSDGAVNASFDGGGNYLSGSILEHAIVEYAGSTSTEGAVRAINSSPFIVSSTVQQNARTGLYVNGSGASSIHVEDNTISSNTNNGVYVYNADWAQLSGNTISGNTDSGVYVDGSGSSTLTDNTITDNTGSGVYVWSSGSSTLTNNTISGNTAGSGGGVYLRYSGSFTLTDNTITDNTASNLGGGVYLSASASTLTNNTITNNTAGGHGGGLYVSSDGAVSLSQDRITANHTNLVDGAGGVFVGYSGVGLDLTGPDDPDNPELSVQIYGNDGYQFYNNSAFGGSFGYTDPGNVDARYVYWGTTDPAHIEAGIYDFFDSASKGVVFYDPYTVPEPATLGLLVMGGLSLLRRRRGN